MNDETNIWLVDAHTKGDGGNDDQGLSRGPRMVNGGLCIIAGNSRVVKGTGDAPIGKEGRELLCAITRLAVDDA